MKLLLEKMGIFGLLNQLQEIQIEKHVSVYANERVGVDAYVWLHQAKIKCSVDIVCKNDYSGFLLAFQSKLDVYLGFRVNLVLVFEGDNLKAKEQKQREREESRQKTLEKVKELLASGNRQAAQGLLGQILEVTPSMAYKAIKLAKQRGLECIVAPFEADAQLAYLAKIKYVHAVITEDSDLLAFGAPRVMFKTESDATGQEIQFQDLGSCKDITMNGWSYEEFLFCCIFAGCDFVTCLKPLGFKKAYELFDALGRDYKKVLNSLAGRCQDKEEYRRQFIMAYLTFRFEKVWCPLKKRVVFMTDWDLDEIRAIPFEIYKEKVKEPRATSKNKILI